MMDQTWRPSYTLMCLMPKKKLCRTALNLTHTLTCEEPVTSFFSFTYMSMYMKGVTSGPSYKTKHLSSHLHEFSFCQDTSGKCMSSLLFSTNLQCSRWNSRTVSCASHPPHLYPKQYPGGTPTDGSTRMLGRLGCHFGQFHCQKG